MRICLINPTMTISTFLNNEQAFVHLGIGYMAAVLEENGFKVDIIECALQGVAGAELLRKITDQKYDAVGFSIYYFNYLNTSRLIGKIKASNPSIFLFAGGYFPTLNYTYLLNAVRGIDCCVLGEGEYTSLELMNAISQSKDWRHVSGIAYKQGNTVMKTDIRPLVPNLDILPFPKRVYLYKDNVASIIASRGCYQNCSFCGLRSFLDGFLGDNVRMRSVENVIDEMEYLVKECNVERIYFQDNNLLTNRLWLDKFYNSLKERDVKVKFHIYARTNNIYDNKDILMELKSIGLDCIFVEFGSFVQRQIDFYNKNTTSSNVLKGFQVLAELGINYIMGLVLLDPFVTISEILSNIETMKSIEYYKHAFYHQTPVSCLMPLYPIHDTPFYKYMEKEGLIEDDKTTKYSFIDADVIIFSDTMVQWKQKVIATINKLDFHFTNEAQWDSELINRLIIKREQLLKTDLEFLESLCIEIINNNKSNENLRNLLKKWETYLNLINENIPS
ncbi:MAG: radical SAM protein [Lutisporaceae bacterium]